MSRETRAGSIDVAPAVAARAACDSDIVDARTPKRLAHHIPPRTRAFVFARDRGRCVVPGCSGRAIPRSGTGAERSSAPGRECCEIHHVVPRAHGGTHDPAGLALLCDAHHTAVHEGKLRIAGRGGRFRFFRDDGAEIGPRAGSAAALSDAARAVLRELDGHARDADEIIERTGLATPIVLAALTELELGRLVERAAGVFRAIAA